MAGRSIPFIFPKLVRAEYNTAPVLPAETKAEAIPSLTRLVPTTIEESGLLRTASTGDSLGPIVWLASMIVIPNFPRWRPAST
ncbi:hypothetical protein ES703_121776 [subsurface metagenome]